MVGRVRVWVPLSLALWPFNGVGGAPKLVGPPETALAARCEAFASETVRQSRAAAANYCEDSGAHWSDDWSKTYVRCLKAPEAELRQETAARAQDLARCNAAVSRCSLYANTAVQQYIEARRLGCKIKGARWHEQWGVHFDWCQTRAGPTEASAQDNLRRMELAACRGHGA